MAKRGGYRPGAGRKKGLSSVLAEKMRDELMKQLDANWKPIVKKAIEQSKEGNPNAREWLSERGLGKVPQAVITKDEEGNDVPLQSINVTAIENGSKS